MPDLFFYLDSTSDMHRSTQATGSYYMGRETGLSMTFSVFFWIRQVSCFLPEGPAASSRCGSLCLMVKRGVDKVNVFLAHTVLRKPQALAESLEVYDLPLPQKLDDVIDIRIVAEAEDIVIGNAGFLLRCKILCQVGDEIALAGHACRAVGEAGGGGGIYAGSAVHKIGVKPSGLDLLLGKIAGQLMDDGPDHFQMSQLFRTDVSQQPLQLRVGHGEPLAEIPQGRAQLPVRSSILTDNQRSQLRVGVFNPDGILQPLLINEQGSLSQVYPAAVTLDCCNGP